jgi:mRNA interferase RelE/StbE
VAFYSVSYRPSVEKDFQSISRPLVTRIIERIERLASDPFPSQSARLQGAERLYRLRVGDYRVVYEVNTEALRIVILYVRHRREVYRRLP